ncbi:MAG TPA: cytochrome c [Verrucomicrobiae bacterium]|nr:cytochrome c [Verrucomicrobiae bacterium]
MKFISLAAIILLVSAFALAQDAPTSTAPEVRHIPITDVPSNSGKEMFKSYCAVCHGSDAKGDGPAAPALKAMPTDLTLLAQKNGGKYPSAHVASVIRGQAAMASHGSQDMPIWGPLFSSMSQGHEGLVQQRTTNLVAYIETLQAK